MSGTGARLSLLLFAGLFWLVACSNSDETKVQQQAQPAVPGTPDSPVLARVDGTAITERDLQQAMDRFFSGQGQIRDRAQVEQQVLRSLVSSRAISRLAEKELDAADQQLLDAKVAAYREELLVQAYLGDHANPQPVTSEMVQAYYSRHKAEFGGGVNNRFEIIRTTRELQAEERRSLIELLGGLSAEPNWQSWAEKHKALPIGWRQLTAKTELLKQPLKGLVATTSAGATSALHVGDQLTIVRVNAKEELPAKPLEQVSAEIRRKLAPIKMKEAIKEISASAEKQMQIEIINPGEKGITEN